MQEGLYIEAIQGRYTIYYCLQAESGYCFYDKNEEIYDEEGNLIIDENEKKYRRTYYKKAYVNKQDIENYVSLKIEKGIDVV